MIVIKLNNGYLTAFLFGSPQTSFSKQSALKFMTDYEAEQFLRNNSYFGQYVTESAF